MKHALVSLVVLSGLSCHPRPSPSPVTPMTPMTPITTATAAIRIEPILPLADEGSAIVLAKVGSHRVALVADEDEGAVHTIDLDEHRALARTPIIGRPSALLLSRGTLLVVRRDAASIAVLEADAPTLPLRATGELLTADEPIAIARAPGNDETVWIGSGWGRALEAFDLATNTKTSTIPLPDEARAVLVSRDGNRALVGYLAQPGLGRVILPTRSITLAAIEQPGFVSVCAKHTKGCPPSRPHRFARQTFSLARLPGWKETVLAPYTMVASGKPEARTGGYGASGFVSPNVFDVASVDVDGIAQFSAPSHDPSCALPRAAVVDATSQLGYVACLGSQVVVELAPNASSLASIRTRLSVEGGPSALAIDGDKRELWVLRSFDRKLERLRLGPGGSFAAEIKPSFERPLEIGLPHVDGLGLASNVAYGRRLFHREDDRISVDGRTCASCHPDGRDDGVTWPTPEGPRQTMFLAGRLVRATPFGWSNAHTTLTAHVKSTLQNIRGTGLDDAALADLEAYLRALPPPPRSKHALTGLEARGREVFDANECSGCHGDGRPHDVKSAVAADKDKLFVAPSLHFVGGSAPYFHDGHFATLRAMLVGSASMSPATSAKALSGEDLDALEAYLRTL